MLPPPADQQVHDLLVAPAGPDGDLRQRLAVAAGRLVLEVGPVPFPGQPDLSDPQNKIGQPDRIGVGVGVHDELAGRLGRRRGAGGAGRARRRYPGRLCGGGRPRREGVSPPRIAYSMIRTALHAPGQPGQGFPGAVDALAPLPTQALPLAVVLAPLYGISVGHDGLLTVSASSIHPMRVRMNPSTTCPRAIAL